MLTTTGDSYRRYRMKMVANLTWKSASKCCMYSVVLTYLNTIENDFLIVQKKKWLINCCYCYFEISVFLFLIYHNRNKRFWFKYFIDINEVSGGCKYCTYYEVFSCKVLGTEQIIQNITEIWIYSFLFLLVLCVCSTISGVGGELCISAQA